VIDSRLPIPLPAFALRTGRGAQVIAEREQSAAAE